MKFKTFSETYNVKEKGIVSLRVYFDNYDENNLIICFKDIYHLTEVEADVYNYTAQNEEIKSFFVNGDLLNIVIK